MFILNKWQVKKDKVYSLLIIYKVLYDNGKEKIMKIIKQLLNRMKVHHIESFSSQIAFYLMLSIFPFIILLFMLLTSLSISYADQMVFIYNAIPNEVASIIKEYLNYSQQFSNSFLSPLLIISMWMSSNAIIALMKSLNIAYDLEETRNYFIRKFLAILCTLMTIILIATALIIPTLAINVMAFIRRYLNVPEMHIMIFNSLRIVWSASVFILVLGGLYFILPNKKVALKEVIPGTLFSFIGLVVISNLFAYFVTEFSSYSLVYGSLAAVIVLLIWMFLCGLILMLGGELNAIYNQKKIEIKKN